MPSLSTLILLRTYIIFASTEYRGAPRGIDKRPETSKIQMNIAIRVIRISYNDLPTVSIPRYGNILNTVVIIYPNLFYSDYRVPTTLGEHSIVLKRILPRPTMRYSNNEPDNMDFAPPAIQGAATVSSYIASDCVGNESSGVGDAKFRYRLRPSRL